MRELREFRVHHSEFAAAGVVVAGVSRDTVSENRRWEERLELPYPLLSDRDGVLGRALGVLRGIRLHGWTIEFVHRSTLLAGIDGTLAAVWSRVRIRGHARQVLEAARAAMPPGRSAP